MIFVGAMHCGNPDCKRREGGKPGERRNDEDL